MGFYLRLDVHHSHLIDNLSEQLTERHFDFGTTILMKCYTIVLLLS